MHQTMRLKQWAPEPCTCTIDNSRSQINGVLPSGSVSRQSREIDAQAIDCINGGLILNASSRFSSTGQAAKIIKLCDKSTQCPIMVKLKPGADGEIGRRTTLKMWRLRSCRFESDSAHSINFIGNWFVALLRRKPISNSKNSILDKV